MKAIIILILSFLLFSYSISAEEKNGVVTEPAKNSEIKVLEKQINIQKKALSELSSTLGQKTEWFIVGAAAIGTLLGAVLGAWISYFLTNKSTRDISKNNIIADSLKFLFKGKDLVGNIIEKKEQSLNPEKTSTWKATKLHSELLKDYDEDLEGWYDRESRFHLYQLERLKNKKITNEFDCLFLSQHKLLGQLLADCQLNTIKDAYTKHKNLLSQLVSKCSNISKV